MMMQQIEGTIVGSIALGRQEGRQEGMGANVQVEGWPSIAEKEIHP